MLQKSFYGVSIVAYFSNFEQNMKGRKITAEISVYRKNIFFLPHQIKSMFPISELFFSFVFD